MKKIIDLFYRALQIIVTTLMMILLIPVAMQILSRFTDLIPRYIWTEEVARLNGRMRGVIADSCEDLFIPISGDAKSRGSASDLGACQR